MRGGLSVLQGGVVLQGRGVSWQCAPSAISMLFAAVAA